MAIEEITEGNAREHIARFKDALKRPAPPDTAEYKLYCETTRKVIVDWTPLTVQQNAPGLSGFTAQFRITTQQNSIQDDYNRRELKTLYVIANRLGDNARQGKLQYYVRNEKGLP